MDQTREGPARCRDRSEAKIKSPTPEYSDLPADWQTKSPEHIGDIVAPMLADLRRRMEARA